PSTLIEGYRLAVTSFLCQPWSNRAFPFAFHSIWFSLTGVDEGLSPAFEIGLEWVVCRKTGLSTTFATTPSTMTKIMKLKPQVEGLQIFGKGGYGRPSRVKRSK
ncbi:hypothetical protein ABG983_07970, partial [Collinsella aerofaciens]